MTKESENTVSYGVSNHFHTPQMTHTIVEDRITKEDIKSGNNAGAITKVWVSDEKNKTTAELVLFRNYGDNKSYVKLKESDKSDKLFFPNVNSNVQTAFIANFFKSFSKDPEKKHVQEISDLFCHAAQHDDVEDSILENHTISRRTVRG